jgi:tetratricopeptide (TPR) repeat protein
MSELAFGEALSYFDEALTQNPDHLEASMSRGLTYWMQRDFLAARHDFDKVLNSEPNHTLARYYRGLTAMGMLDYESSIVDFEKVTSGADSTFPREDLIRAHRMTGISYLNLEKYDLALGQFTTCIEMAPEIGLHFLERGGVYEVLGKNEQAISDYEALLSISDSTNAMDLEVQSRLARLRGGAIVTNL